MSLRFVNTLRENLGHPWRSVNRQPFRLNSLLGPQRAILGRFRFWAWEIIADNTDMTVLLGVLCEPDVD